jgi:hypothetical protein
VSNAPCGSLISAASSKPLIRGAVNGPCTVPSKLSRAISASPARVFVPSVGKARALSVRSRTWPELTVPVMSKRATFDVMRTGWKRRLLSSPTVTLPTSWVVPLKTGAAGAGSNPSMRAARSRLTS